MTKQWLRHQGLVFLRYLWGDLVPLRRTARCGPASQVVWEGGSRKAIPYPDLCARYGVGRSIPSADNTMPISSMRISAAAINKKY